MLCLYGKPFGLLSLHSRNGQCFWYMYFVFQIHILYLNTFKLSIFKTHKILFVSQPLYAVDLCPDMTLLKLWLRACHIQVLCCQKESWRIFYILLKPKSFEDIKCWLKCPIRWRAFKHSQWYFVSLTILDFLSCYFAACV